MSRRRTNLTQGPNVKLPAPCWVKLRQYLSVGNKYHDPGTTCWLRSCYRKETCPWLGWLVNLRFDDGGRYNGLSSTLVMELPPLEALARTAE